MNRNRSLDLSLPGEMGLNFALLYENIRKQTAYVYLRVGLNSLLTCRLKDTVSENQT